MNFAAALLWNDERRAFILPAENDLAIHRLHYLGDDDGGARLYIRGRCRMETTLGALRFGHPLGIGEIAARNDEIEVRCATRPQGVLYAFGVERRDVR